MSIKFAAGLAAGLGIVVTFACLFTAPIIYNEIHKISLELNDEMQIFKVNFFIKETYFRSNQMSCGPK